MNVVRIFRALSLSPDTHDNAFFTPGPRVPRECLSNSHVSDHCAPERYPGVLRDPDPATNTTWPGYRGRSIGAILVNQCHGQAKGPRS